MTSANTVYVERLVFWYVKRTYLPTEKELQLVSKLFAAVTERLGVKHLMTTAYSPGIDGQVGQFTISIFLHPQLCVAQHQTELNQHAQLLMYSCSVQVHQLMCLTPLSLVLPRQPPGLTKAKPGSGKPDDTSERIQL